MKKTLVVLCLFASALMATSCTGGGKRDGSAATEAGSMTFEQATAKAAAENKFVIIDFYTDWCGWCKKLDNTTYADPAVAQALAQDFILVKINPEKNGSFQYLGKSYSGSDLMNLFGVRGFPGSVFLSADGTPVQFTYTDNGQQNQVQNAPGYYPPDKYLKLLAAVKGGPRTAISLDDL